MNSRRNRPKLRGGRPGAGREVRTFVAVGDSFTAGNGCDPECRWADLVAAGLRQTNPGLRYSNLARDGADSRDVLEQIPAAIGCRPDLVTLVCGANDVILGPRPDIPAFVARFELMLDRLKRALPGVAILTATYPEAGQPAGIGPRTLARIRAGMSELNRMIRRISGERSVPCVDTVDHPGLRDPENFETDGLHPSTTGHRRAAAEFSAALRRNFSIYIPNRRSDKWQ